MSFSKNPFQAELEEKRRLAAEVSPAGGDSHSEDRSGAEAAVPAAAAATVGSDDSDDDGGDPKLKFSLELKPPGHSANTSKGNSLAATPLRSPSARTPKEPSEDFLKFQVHCFGCQILKSVSGGSKKPRKLL